MGPVGISALLVLIVLAPLMRGGNRQVALIVLEAAALVLLVALAARPAALAPARRGRWERAMLAFLLASPAWLAVIYLVPLPTAWWASTGRRDYLDAVGTAGIALSGPLPLSLVPDATMVSLFAGIPLVAAFLGGYLAQVPRLRLILAVLVALAFLEVVLGLLQVAGGRQSVLYFGGYGGRPFGTFANPNHYANYIAMALAAYIWLGWMKQRQARSARDGGWAQGPLARHATLLWLAGGVVLVLGVLMSRSRGSALGGLPAAMLAFALALTTGRRSLRWRSTLLVVGASLAAALALVGVEMVMHRFDLDRLSQDASIRATLAASTMEGAAHFWPWGAGWGTYAAVFPRFQPAAVTGYVDYAHHDYAQMLFEGGVFAVLLMAAFAWLALARATLLVKLALRQGRLGRAEMASAICGLGLLGFLLHSLVEFNMHIPANAIAASLLAGIYLRPLQREEETADD